ncbi:YccF domain-containing protein [Pseudonocardia nigra]|uniref:YccF domain-containing protein n=1 Tax=Pseudonocardia nigra TaxID=1921578 RepID=UPI001C5E3CAE|nr:YccF domain-containing protein [Pseudonocardia nigra]
MRTIGNVLWLVLAGWWLALAYAIAGLLACVLIVTIPFGIASFRLAGYALWPFGRRVVVHRTAGLPSVLGNVLWILLFGWELAVLHVLAGVLLMVTIVGIPFGIASFKLAVLALVPLGTRVVEADEVWVPQYETRPAYR